MIRPATDLLKRRVGGTFLAVSLLTVAWIASGAALFFASSLDRLSRLRMEDFRPVIYLEAGEDGEAAKSISSKVAQWGTVAAAEVRTPRDAYRQAADRIGEERLSGAGVRPGMFPYSVIVRGEDTLWNPDLVAKLEALETRGEVDAVDVPSESVRGVLGSAQGLLYGAALPLAVLVAAALAQLGAFLRELRRSEQRKLAVLERFGAGRWQLARPTLVRGALIGLWAGLAATTILLVMALYWRTIETSIFGGVPSATPGNWWVVVAPLLASPLGGAAIGTWIAQSGLDSDTDGSRAVLSSIELLLDYE